MLGLPSPPPSCSAFAWPARFVVITTAIWEAVQSFPPRPTPRAAALGISLSAVHVRDARRSIAPVVIRRGNFATITGKAFRPRAMAMGRMAWVLFALCFAYVVAAVFLPLGALLLTSFQRFATVILSQSQFTLGNYQAAFGFGAVRQALTNSLMLGFGVATVGVAVMTVLVWIIYRSKAPGHGLIEYVVMFPQAVPRMVFGLALLWAWLNIPIPIYGTLWLLALAYFTVLLPLGVRTLAGVVLQIDKSLEECARVCGASWSYQLRIGDSMPLLRASDRRRVAPRLYRRSVQASSASRSSSSAPTPRSSPRRSSARGSARRASCRPLWP